MKFELPGQLRGADTHKVMKVAIRIRKELELHFFELKTERIHKISPILRVGGELGTFGEDGIENINKGNKEVECDIVLAPRNWGKMTEKEIYTLLLPFVIKASILLLKASGISEIPLFLSELEMAEKNT